MPANAVQPERDQPLNVLLLIGDLSHGGAERQVILLANGLAQENVNVHIATFTPLVPLAESLLDQNRLHVLPGRSPLGVARLMRELDIRIVHAFLLDAEIIACLAARFVRGVLPIVSERSTRHTYAAWQTAIWRVTTGNAALCIANTGEGMRWHSASFARPRELYRVVRNGIDTRRFRPTDATGLRMRLGIAQQTLVIGLFASFKAMKNHGLLLSASRTLIDRGHDLRILLVGAGVARGSSVAVNVERMIRDHGLDDKVIVLGTRDDPENIYPACDLTVLPSSHEGTPNVVLESMACGVPVLISDAPGNREVADQCSAVRTFPLEGAGGGVDSLVSALEKFISQRDRLKALGELCRTQVEARYGLPRLMAETANAYREATARARP